MIPTGWRAVVLTILAVLFLVALATVLFWLALGLAVVAALAALHLVYLPRAAARLGLPPLILTALPLPALVLVGWALGGSDGMLVGALVWLGGMAAPRLALWSLARRFHVVTLTWPPPTEEVAERRQRLQPPLTGVTCSKCGLVSFPGADDGVCPRCGAPLDRCLRRRPSP